MNDTQIQEKTEGQPEKKAVEKTPTNMLEEAEARAARIEAANAKTEELLARQEALAARQLFAGRSEAGIQPEPKKELTDIEYSQKVMSGEINPMQDVE